MPTQVPERKTKALVQMLEKLGAQPGRKTLVITKEANADLMLAGRNVPTLAINTADAIKVGTSVGGCGQSRAADGRCGLFKGKRSSPCLNEVWTLYGCALSNANVSVHTFWWMAVRKQGANVSLPIYVVLGCLVCTALVPNYALPCCGTLRHAGVRRAGRQQDLHRAGCPGAHQRLLRRERERISRLRFAAAVLGARSVTVGGTAPEVCR